MEEKRLKIACYDSDFIPYYVCHNKKDEPIKTLKECIQKCDELILNMNNLLGVDFYCGFRTVGKCFRYNINPGYKANRKYEHVNYLKEVQEHLSNYHNFYGQEEYEADDLVMSFKAQNKQADVIIISPDKDILGAVDYAYNARKNEYVTNTKDEIIENFWKSMITGDSVDGIKGIPGKGEAYAKKLFQSVNTLGLWHRELVLRSYIEHFGEYEGIKEFTKNYLSLKIVDDVELKNIKLNEIIY